MLIARSEQPIRLYRMPAAKCRGAGPWLAFSRGGRDHGLEESDPDRNLCRLGNQRLPAGRILIAVFGLAHAANDAMCGPSPRAPDGQREERMTRQGRSPTS